MVAWGGIEPPTRGFSMELRATFGTAFARNNEQNQTLTAQSTAMERSRGQWKRSSGRRKVADESRYLRRPRLTHRRRRSEAARTPGSATTWQQQGLSHRWQVPEVQANVDLTKHHATRPVERRALEPRAAGVVVQNDKGLAMVMSAQPPFDGLQSGHAAVLWRVPLLM